MDRKRNLTGGNRLSVAITGSVASTASFLQKKTSKGVWSAKRWYELSESKIAYYATAAKKAELGNMPLFSVVGVKGADKPTHFIVETSDASGKREILFRAATESQREEWVKTLSVALEQRKAHAFEASSVDVTTTPGPTRASTGGVASPGSIKKDGSSSASKKSSTEIKSKGKEEDDDDDDGEDGVDAVRGRDDTQADFAGDAMSKEAQEKFVQQMRSMVLEQNVAGVRSMLDPRPPRDALMWYSRDELGRTLLHLAVDTGDLKVVDVLATHDPRLLELTDQLGWTPFHLAAYKGSVEMGELLLKLGTSVGKSDNHGRTPLYIALASGKSDFVKFLMRKTAGPDWLPVQIAAAGGVRAHLEKEAESDKSVLTKAHPTLLLTAIHFAASSTSPGSADAVLYLLEQGASVNVADFLQKTPLHFAAASGAIDCVRVLLAKGADANARDSTKRTPLHFAAASMHPEVVELLLEKGAGHSPEDESGWSALHLACFQGHAPTVRALVAKGSRVDARGPRALTPLMLCCTDSMAPVAEVLLQADADANAIGREGRTALFDAVSNQSMEVCKLLIKHDVNVNRADDAGGVAIHHALDWPAGFLLLLENGADASVPLTSGSTLLYEMSLRGQLECVKALRERGKVDISEATSESDHSYSTGLQAACANGHLDLVKFYVENKVPLDAVDKEGRSALHLACTAGGNVQALQALLDAGSEAATLQDASGNTPLHLAAETGREECCRALKKAGATVDVQNMAGKTPLHVAAESKAYGCTAVLLEGCSDAVPAIRDSNGRTALHYALRAADAESAISLIWAGVSPNIADNDGVTSFHLASRLGKRKVLAEMLAKEQIDIARSDGSKRSCIHYASAGGSPEVLQIILENAGATKKEIVNSRDSHGTSALHFATEFNHVDCAKLLLEAGARLDTQNEVGLYPLHTACKKGKACLELLLQWSGIARKGASQPSSPSSPVVGHQPLDYEAPGIDVRDHDQLTPLLIAVLHGNVAAVSLLLEYGADIDAVDLEGLGVVHASMEPDDATGVKLLRLLAEKGAKFTAVDNEGSSCLHLAAASGRSKVLEFLLSVPNINVNARDAADRTPLLLAAAAGHAKCVEFLCRDQRVDMSAKNREGQNALHVASMGGKFDAARWLLTREDFDKAAVDGTGRTALHNSVLHDNVEFTQLLLRQYKLDPNVATHQSVTPLHEACVRGSLRCAKILLDAGARVNAEALQGLTPLHNAASFAQNDCIELLMQWRAAVNCASERGLTPLHCAAAMSHSRTCVLLVKLGADVDAVDATLETPLHKAAQAGSLSSVTVLIERGADVNAKNERGERPYDKARKKGYQEVCDTLRDNS